MLHFVFVSVLAGALVSRLLNKQFPKGKAGWLSAFILGAIGYIPGSLMSFGFGIRTNIISDIALTTAGTFLIMFARAYFASRKSQPAKQ